MGTDPALDEQPIGCIIAGVTDVDAVFRALADPTRRRVLDRLHERGGQTLGELCEGMGMSRQAVSKHLAQLESAGLVSAVRRGREKLHHLDPVPIQEIHDRWIGKFERSRVQAITTLRAALEDRDDLDE
ncbi:DNA-binding transcriptional regulator, ArsR family [Pseudonocardia ammonioxydans]|uniref:DNA-binding transcriptional regulator, ArsR family n=1 Tax=Pseudonocardia ammonioxydans TaxID=260086 RepID=A0A1I5EPY4_PSUAM|nr:DNA-binding transcriptional regulator, ArsR family [Pseudonocardia ammonioxydans]